MSKLDGFNQHAQRIADNLRRMADEVEREAKSHNSVDERAQEIVDTVTWGVANLNLGLLMRWTVRVLEQRAKEDRE
jgi:hypothetical protein